MGVTKENKSLFYSLCHVIILISVIKICLYGSVSLFTFYDRITQDKTAAFISMNETWAVQ